MHNQQQEDQPRQQQYQESTTYEILREPSTNNGPTKYKLANKQVLVHGAIHIVIGFLDIIFYIVLLCVYLYSECYIQYDCGWSSKSGSGIWCGICIIITGGFGIVAAKKKTKCPIIAYLVLSIINSVAAAALLWFGSWDIKDAQQYGHYFHHYGQENRSFRISTSDFKTTYVALGSLTVIMGVTELVISIWSSALCCAAVYCCAHTKRNTRQQQVAYINGNNPAGKVYPTQASCMYYPHTTYIQGGAPIHTRSQLQPVYIQVAPEPPAYTELNDVSQSGYDGEPTHSKSLVP